MRVLRTHTARDRAPWVSLLFAVLVAGLSTLACATPRLFPECANLDAAWSRDLLGPRPRVTLGPVLGKTEEIGCRDFRLSTSDVQAFFKNARVVQGWHMNHEYSWFGCRQEGKLFARGRAYDWSITPGGTAEVSFEGRLLFFLACDCFAECLEVFPNGGNEFFGEGVGANERCGARTSRFQDTD